MSNRYSVEEYIEIKENEKKELSEKLSNGIKDALNSDRYKNYLKLMSRCYNYSYTNSMLIYLQNENATIVKSFTDWKKDKVNINKEEKGIKIFCPVKKKINIYKTDEKGEVFLNEKGEKVKVGEQEYITFNVGNVFDISQTNANPEDYQLKTESNEKVLNKEEIIKKLQEVSNIKFEFVTNLGRANGMYMPNEEKIKIRANMGDIKTISTCVHEVAHSILHKVSSNLKLSNVQKEFEAESVAYVVCEKLNVDSKKNNFLYLADWVEKEDLSEFKDSLERIQKASNDILKKFENQKENTNLKHKSSEVER